MSRAPDFVVSIIKRYWKPGQRILEIGCGPAFLRDDFGADYLGVDITDKPYTEDLLRDVDIVCSADNLLIDDSSIDIVIIKSAFYMFSDHILALREARRVLKPNGILLIFDYNRRTQRMLQKKEGHTNYGCWTQWGLKNLVQANGFKDVKNLVAANDQLVGLSRILFLLKQELFGSWAIICGVKY